MIDVSVYWLAADAADPNRTLPTFSQAFLSEGKATWWKIQSLYSLVRYLGGSESTAAVSTQ